MASDRKRKRAEAFSRPGTGQFTPGALSKASAQYAGGGTRRSVAPSLSGGLSDPRRSQDVHTKAPPSYDIGMSEAFQKKFLEGENMQSLRQEMPEMAGAPQDVLTREPLSSEAMPVAQEGRGGVAGAYDVLNEASSAVINTVLNFIENQGGGDFQKGIYSLITLPVGGGVGTVGTITKSTTGTIAKHGAGTISKDVLRTGGAKTMNTLKLLVSKIFTRDKIVGYVKEGSSRMSYRTEIVSRITPWGVMKAVGAAGAFATAAAYLTLNGLQSKAIGTRDVGEELAGYGGMLARDMYRDGNRELGDMFLDMSMVASDVTISAMPGGKGTIQGTKIYSDFFNETAPMLKQHYAEMEEMEAEGMTPEQTADFWIRYHARLGEMEIETARIKNEEFNASKELGLRMELRLRADAHATKLASERNAMVAQAEYWLKYREKLAKMAEEERIKQMKFWFEYKKMVMKLQAESGRSHLGFGILR